MDVAVLDVVLELLERLVDDVAKVRAQWQGHQHVEGHHQVQAQFHRDVRLLGAVRRELPPRRQSVSGRTSREGSRGVELLALDEEGHRTRVGSVGEVAGRRLVARDHFRDGPEAGLARAPGDGGGLDHLLDVGARRAYVDTASPLARARVVVAQHLPDVARRRVDRDLFLHLHAACLPARVGREWLAGGMAGQWHWRGGDAPWRL
mmetsp:Transcript_2406/g.7185  ORF Transcript_2406/g.7185 Transcript_2406/m.7185 type:complete len:205 (-) Transcript_2406:90-704(-)